MSQRRLAPATVTAAPALDAALTGWILTLFPYIESFVADGERLIANPHLARREKAWRNAEARRDWHFTPEGPALGAIPGSIASAPVTFIDVRDDSVHPLRVAAGLFGAAQDESTHALAPEFGWAVVHEPA